MTNSATVDLQRNINNPIKNHELYPYNRISKEVSRQTSKIVCSHSFIVGIALEMYCNAKLELIKRLDIPCGTEGELIARDLITDKQIEVMVSDAISGYNGFLKETLDNQTYIIKNQDKILKEISDCAAALKEAKEKQDSIIQTQNDIYNETKKLTWLHRLIDNLKILLKIHIKKILSFIVFAFLSWWLENKFDIFLN